MPNTKPIATDVVVAGSEGNAKATMAVRMPPINMPNYRTLTNIGAIITVKLQRAGVTFCVA